MTRWKVKQPQVKLLCESEAQATDVFSKESLEERNISIPTTLFSFCILLFFWALVSLQQPTALIMHFPVCFLLTVKEPLVVYTKQDTESNVTKQIFKKINPINLWFALELPLSTCDTLAQKPNVNRASMSSCLSGSWSHLAVCNIE